MRKNCPALPPTFVRSIQHEYSHLASDCLHSLFVDIAITITILSTALSNGRMAASNPPSSATRSTRATPRSIGTSIDEVRGKPPFIDFQCGAGNAEERVDLHLRRHELGRSQVVSPMPSGPEYGRNRSLCCTRSRSRTRSRISPPTPLASV